MSKNILVKPILTEKMTKMGEKLNKFGFVVDRNANKIQIRNAVEEMYGVTVESVNTYIMPGKNRRRFTRSGVLSGRTKVVKKAIVSLAEGETIDFFEDV